MKLKFLADNSTIDFLLRNTKKLINKISSKLPRLKHLKTKQKNQTVISQKSVPLPSRDRATEILIEPILAASKANALTDAVQSKFLLEN